MLYSNLLNVAFQFFYKHELLAPYKWYWRVEPEVEFTCPIDFDPFVYMIENNKRYSFVVSLEEIKATVHTLWDTVKGALFTYLVKSVNASYLFRIDFRKEYPKIIAENNALPFISDDDGETYNFCHCTSFHALLFFQFQS